MSAPAQRPAPNPIVKKVSLSLVSLLIFGFGCYMVVVPAAFAASARGESTATGRRTAAVLEILYGLVDTVGAIPTGITVALIGAAALFFTWKDYILRPAPTP